jgi:5-methylcytosine-specific restriction endonuclease McrA
MWERSPDEYARKFGIKLAQAQRLKCTAEHLQARSVGGKDTSENIVAACLHCNQARHKMHPAPDHTKFRRIVQQQSSNGCWHKKNLVIPIKAKVLRS